MNARKTEQLQAVLSALHQRWGAAAPRPLRVLTAPQDTPVLATGFDALDAWLGIGGLPYQQITTLIGLPTAGLTTLAYRIMASSQRAGGIVVLFDTSQTFDPEYAQRCGVDSGPLLVIRQMDWASALEILRDVVGLTGSGLLVWDAGIGRQRSSTDWQRLADTLSRVKPLLPGTHWTLLVLLPREIPDNAAVRLHIQRSNWLADSGAMYGYRAQVTVLKNRFAPCQDPISLDITLGEDGI